MAQLEFDVAMLGNGRTIAFQDGMPVLVGLTMRRSTSAPCRIKATLAVPVACGDHKHLVPLPFAQSIVGQDGAMCESGLGWTPEFRLEMN